MTPGEQPRVAVVGAGLAGLSCARRLAEGGWDVRLFDKSRKPGGRCATRRAEAGHFDHGAQFFTVRDERFAAVVDGLVASGDVAIWPGPFATLCAGERGDDPRVGALRYVAVPGMSALPRALADGLDVTTRSLITVLRRASDGLWWLGSCASGGAAKNEPERWHGPFHRVVLALPPWQAEALLAAEHGIVPEAAVAMRGALQPCFCAMVRFQAPVAEATGGMFVRDEVLSWAAHDGGKPGRDGAATYVLHATADWSKQQLDRDAGGRDVQESSAMLVAAFERSLAVSLPAVDALIGHRWAYALASGTPGDRPFACDDQGLGLVGDALAGGRVEGAFVSGLELAEAWLAEPLAEVAV